MGATGEFVVVPGGRLDRWRELVEDPGPLLDITRDNLHMVSDQAFEKQEWDGEPWAERMNPNWPGIVRDIMDGRKSPKANRTKAGPALQDTNTLRKSLAAVRIAIDTIQFGSNLSYAPKQRHGQEEEIGPFDQGFRGTLWAWLKKQSRELKKELGWLLNKKWLEEPIRFSPTPREFVGVTDEARAAINEDIVRFMVSE